MARNDPELIIKSVGEGIRRLRKARSLSQEELGRLSGTSWMTVNRLENATVGTKLDNLCAIVGTLEASLAEVFAAAEGGGKKIPPAPKTKWDAVRAAVDGRTSVERDWIASIVERLLERP